MAGFLHNAGVRATAQIVIRALAGFGGGIGATLVHPAAAGKQGVAGPPGVQGEQGLTGAPGSAGPPGQSASAHTVHCQAFTGGSYKASSPDTFNAVVVGLGTFAGQLEYANLTITCTVSP
jgi:hypothetical protein